MLDGFLMISEEGGDSGWIWFTHVFLVHAQYRVESLNESNDANDL